MTRVDNILMRHKGRTAWWLTAAVFSLLSFCFRLSLHEPPVWDGAMSVYPAAVELARTNFDFAGLLSLPAYLEGGPNTHTTSAWTILVAGLITLTGSLTSALPILHMLSLALAALTAAATFRIIAHSAPASVAVLGALAILLFPPMMAQTTGIYLDLPVACLGTWALFMLIERRILAASVLTAGAVWVKPLGLIFAFVGAGFILTHTPRLRRILWLFRYIIPPLAVAIMISVLQREGPRPDLPDRYEIAVGASLRLLAAMPDLVALGIITVLLIPAMVKLGDIQDTFTLTRFMLLSALVFVLLNPLGTSGIPLLPRYYIAFLPAIVAGILAFLSSKSRRAGLMAAFAMILIFAVNLGGAFYPYRSHPIFFLAERSLAYRDLLALQMEDVSALKELSREMPVYYDYFGYYRFEYPDLGYTDGPVSSGVSVFHRPELANTPLVDFPDRFAFAYEYPVLGGEVLLRIWDEAKASGARITETALSSGTFTVYVIEVDQTPSLGP